MANQALNPNRPGRTTNGKMETRVPSFRQDVPFTQRNETPGNFGIPRHFVRSSIIGALPKWFQFSIQNPIMAPRIVSRRTTANPYEPAGLFTAPNRQELPRSRVYGAQLKGMKSNG
jgi:hypothetical protein